ncbi:MAG: EF-P lysine aminoacylase EpmA [Gammaproteobacteria bacterium]|nr:EF-P lysine aminoacylase EpmA [Gammaproteobacteria bacterium]
MNWQPTATRAVLRARARMLQKTRDFFAQRDVLEVETPILTPCGITDPNIKSVSAQLTGQPHSAFFLHTSPEFAMKRLLAAGMPDIFQICKVFRDGESGSAHQPEFTMIEWYRRDWSMMEMIDETCALIASALCETNLPVNKISYRDLFTSMSEIDPFAASTQEIISWAQQNIKTVTPTLSEQIGHDRSTWLDLIISHAIIPALPPETLLVIHHYPAEQAALARLDPKDKSVAERFEVIYRGMELANGFRELTNADEQRRRFETDNARRAQDNQKVMPIDTQFLAALEAGLPDCSGVAVGFDRLVMLACGLESIDQAISLALQQQQ